MFTVWFKEETYSNLIVFLENHKMQIAKEEGDFGLLKPLLWWLEEE